MKTFNISIKNADGEVDRNEKVPEHNLDLWLGTPFAQVVVNQSNLSELHFKLTLETDLQVWTIERTS